MGIKATQEVADQGESGPPHSVPFLPRASQQESCGSALCETILRSQPLKHMTYSNYFQSQPASDLNECTISIRNSNETMLSRLDSHHNGPSFAEVPRPRKKHSTTHSH